jgi:antitoxin component of MazEF toxin-antitoxin module
VPLEIAKETGLTEGEPVEIEVQDGDLMIRRPAAHVRARASAETAAAEIIAESEHYRLGDVSIRSLLEEGRRG